MVSADTARAVVGIMGNVTALGLFLSPVPTFTTICKRKSVEQFSPVPYLTTFLNCTMWVVYGLPWVQPHGMLLITVNGAGLALQLTYVLLFITYCGGRKRLRVLVLLLVEVAFIVAVVVFTLTLAHSYERRSLIVGSLCAFFGTMMYAAPLSIMRLVIKTESVEYMPLTLSLTAFLNGACWTSYALIRFDLYIMIPNGLGVLLASAQLILHAVFYKSTERQMEERRQKAEMGMTAVVVNGDSNNINHAPHENSLRLPPPEKL